MIKKIDIQKFGIFNDYEWNKTIGGDDDLSFKAVNIIYGRNYSGKTTFSRILKSIEDEKIHGDFSDANFEITLSDNNKITPSNLSDFKDQLLIRVYNSDFVKTNLSWLHNADGSINPFTILGQKNVEIDNQIKAIDEKLGNIELETGLLSEQFKKEENFKIQSNKYQGKVNDLDNKLKDKARDIKNNTKLFNFPTFNISHIKSDIENLRPNSLLNDTEKELRTNLLKEDAKGAIDLVSVFKPNLILFKTSTIEILSKKIEPTKPILDLLHDKLLQEWVRQGIEKHKDIRNTCGFCGSPLPSDLWNKLDAHFSKVSEDLRLEIQNQIDKVESAKIALNKFLKISKNEFYTIFHNQFEELLNQWKNAIDVYSHNLDYFITELNERRNDIFKSRIIDIIQVVDNSQELMDLLSKLNELISANNNKTQNLAKDQQKANKELRISEVALFVNNINYNDKIAEIEALRIETNNLKTDKENLNKEVNILIEQKRVLEAQAKDESKGAELVNQHLINFFGHDELKLVAFGQSPNMKFKITREGVDAKNLSEGECSLISFCYYIAKIEDELKDDVNSNKLIIYIDDPISSLDGNHVFFMFSLIESIIAKPKKYKQLFISTHNLDFLKYLKRITSNKENLNHFLIERRKRQNVKRSYITLMPSHIRDFVTEFNYLFKEIYDLYKEVKGDRKKKLENTYNQFYNIPNNMRKFLECYLFYKYPNTNDPLKNLDKLFDNNVPSLVNRIINEYSHLAHIDRGWKPVDVDEIEECAILIIEKIKEKDINQFDALVDSIKA